MSSKELAERPAAGSGRRLPERTAFGEYGEGYIRFSYAAAYEQLMEAVDRVRDFVVHHTPAARQEEAPAR